MMFNFKYLSVFLSSFVFFFTGSAAAQTQCQLIYSSTGTDNVTDMKVLAQQGKLITSRFHRSIEEFDLLTETATPIFPSVGEYLYLLHDAVERPNGENVIAFMRMSIDRTSSEQQFIVYRYPSGQPHNGTAAIVTETPSVLQTHIDIQGNFVVIHESVDFRGPSSNPIWTSNYRVCALDANLVPNVPDCNNGTLLVHTSEGDRFSHRFHLRAFHDKAQRRLALVWLDRESHAGPTTLRMKYTDSESIRTLRENTAIHSFLDIDNQWLITLEDSLTPGLGEFRAQLLTVPSEVIVSLSTTLHQPSFAADLQVSDYVSRFTGVKPISYLQLERTTSFMQPTFSNSYGNSQFGGSVAPIPRTIGISAHAVAGDFLFYYDILAQELTGRICY